MGAKTQTQCACTRRDIKRPTLVPQEEVQRVVQLVESLNTIDNREVAELTLRKLDRKLDHELLRCWSTLGFPVGDAFDDAGLTGNKHPYFIRLLNLWEA